jgi:hypothetical protein
LNYHDLLQRLDQAIDNADINPEAVAHLVEQTTHAVASQRNFRTCQLLMIRLIGVDTRTSSRIYLCKPCMCVDQYTDCQYRQYVCQ